MSKRFVLLTGKSQLGKNRISEILQVAKDGNIEWDRKWEVVGKNDNVPFLPSTGACLWVRPTFYGEKNNRYTRWVEVNNDKHFIMENVQ